MRPHLLVLPLLLAAAPHTPGSKEAVARLHSVNARILALGGRDRPAALRLAREAVELGCIAHGPVGLPHAYALNRLAEFANSLGEYREAIAAREEALRVTREAVGENHREFGTILGNLASSYRRVGDYVRALPLLERAVEVRAAVHGEDSTFYAAALHNLALVCPQVGRRHHARALYERALAIRIKHLGVADARTQSTRLSLATFLRTLGDRPAALVHYRDGLRHAGTPLERSHAASGIGLLALDADEPGRALPHLLAARADAVRARGPRHPDVANADHNLAAAHARLGDAHRAEALLLRCLDDQRALLGPDSPPVASTLTSMARVALTRGLASEGVSHARSALRVLRRHLDATLSTVGEGERLELIQTYRARLDDYLTLADVAGEPPAARYREVLAWKAAAAQRHLEERLARRQPAAAPLLAELAEARAALVRHASSPATGGRAAHRREAARLEEHKSAVEARLARASAAYRRARSSSPDDVIALLPPDTPLAELIVYTHRTPRGGAWALEPRVLAFVAARGRPVRCVPLGPLAPLADACRAWLTDLRAGREGAAHAAALRRLAWLPISRSAGPATRLLIAPDGVLSSVPWAALPGTRRGSHLIDECAVGLLLSGLHLSELQSLPAATRGLLALGGVDYGEAGPPALPGTRVEAERIAALHRARFGAANPVTLLSGAAADKATVLAGLSRPPRWLHLATHGYFAPTGYAETRAPQILSGLLLARAGRDPSASWTAEEVTSLDLAGCELAVLSACETGLGRVVPGEGVLGLQRAFHLAGVRSVAASLWSVSDPATSVLMERLYSGLWAEDAAGKLEALRQAQLFVRDNPAAVEARARELAKAGMPGLRGVAKGSAVLPGGKTPTGRRSPTAWWAAFLLSGDWR